MTPEARQEHLRAGRLHSRFVVSLYRLQIKEGRKFLHEHPCAASSWREPVMRALLEHADVGTATADQCMYSLYTRGPNGEMTVAKKHTKCASNNPYMLARLRRRCDRSHAHQHVEGGRTAEAAYYPPDLIVEILRGVRDDADAMLLNSEQEEQGKLLAAVAQSGLNVTTDQPTYAQQSRSEEASNSIENTRSQFKVLDGTFTEVNWSFKDSYSGEYTSEPLLYAEIKSAIVDELAFFNEHVLRGVGISEAKSDPKARSFLEELC